MHWPTCVFWAKLIPASQKWADSDEVGGLSDLTWYNPLIDAAALPALERFVRHERVFPCVNSGEA